MDSSRGVSTEPGAIQDVSNTRVSDVAPLAGLKNLQKLFLKDSKVTDFSPLKDIYPNLKEKDFELE